MKWAFRADLNYHVENFKIINANTNEEYRYGLFADIKSVLVARTP